MLTSCLCVTFCRDGWSVGRGSETAACARETALVAKELSSSASRLTTIRNSSRENQQKCCPTAIPANVYCALTGSGESCRAEAMRILGEVSLSGSVPDVSFGYRGVPEEPLLAHPAAARVPSEKRGTGTCLRCPNASDRSSVSQSGYSASRRFFVGSPSDFRIRRSQPNWPFAMQYRRV